MTKQEEIREGIAKIEGNYMVADALLTYLDANGAVLKVDRELPYKWAEITRKHNYAPYKKFTTYTLRNKYNKMFGYVQKYQSLTGYKCFEKPVYYDIYIGDEEWAHSDGFASTLKGAKAKLLKQFLSSKDNPDNEIPTGYVAVEPIIKER